ncbi:DUF2171 domain-containing protein [Sphingomonas sp. RS2018]
MAYDRDYPQDWYRSDPSGRGRQSDLSSAREYYGAERDRDERNFRGGGTGYGDRNRENYGGNRDYYGGDRSYGQNQQGGQHGRQDYGARASGGQRFEHNDAGNSWGRDVSRRNEHDYGRQPQGYDYEDRGFIARAGDEVRSWFGDEGAERRRERDQRYDERIGDGRSGRGYPQPSHDSDYSSWRRSQIEALDRDYHEYRQENARKFDNEFGSWRTNRQTQRTSLSSVNEHMEVLGSDGEHVGTVDKVRGDRIILTKNDADAGGRHHSIPSSWLQSVDDKVTINRTAADAKKHWRDEERSGAFFHESDRKDGDRDQGGKTDLNRSFSGTY